MAKTYQQLQKQIATLQKEADELKRKEVGGVIARIRDAITHYGLTPADLGFRTALKAKAKGTAAAKYSNGAGLSWSGRGPRPAWVKEALAQGKQLSDFLSSGAASDVQKVGPRTKAKASKKPQAKYSNGAGKTWTGRGPKPGWVKEALAKGKQLADLLAS